MAYYKEIVTKSIIGKGKKTTNVNHLVNVEDNINTVLGCWVINHIFNGRNDNGNIVINGSYDINIWYSYDNNSKTNVIIKKFNYQDKMNVRIKENGEMTSNSEIIVRSLNQPAVTDVNLEGNTINLTVHKEMGVEVVGDETIKVSVENDFDDYEEIIDENDLKEETENIEINEDYLK